MYLAPKWTAKMVTPSPQTMLDQFLQHELKARSSRKANRMRRSTLRPEPVLANLTAAMLNWRCVSTRKSAKPSASEPPAYARRG
jgi:hypothetical protein